MSKQDRAYTRTASDLERKYNFGQTFAEVFGLVSDARSAAEEAKKAVDGLSHEEIFNRLTDNGKKEGIYRGEDGDIYINASYLKGGTIAAECLTSATITSPIITGAEITGAEITGGRINGGIFSDTQETSYIQMDTNAGDLAVLSHYYTGYSLTNPLMTMGYIDYEGKEQWILQAMETSILCVTTDSNGQKVVKPQGTWDFSEAEVTG